MAWSSDILDNMEDVKQSPRSKLAPGDLGAIAAAAERLSQLSESPKLSDRSHSAAEPLSHQSAGKCEKKQFGKRSQNLPRAQAAPPQDMYFTVPPNCRAGQPVCVQGPHGPLHIQLPQGYLPGERCCYRFGPPALHLLTVPEGGNPGDIVKFESPDGDALEAKVPPGKEPGDVFEVTPPCMVVQAPTGSQSGDSVVFTDPDGTDKIVVIPQGVKATQYFGAQI